MVGMSKKDPPQKFIFQKKCMFVEDTLGESLEWSVDLK